MLRTVLGNKLASPAANVRLVLPAFFQRSESSVPATIDAKKAEIQKLLSEDLPTPYNGPERDLVNFPRRKRLEAAPRVRMGFLPDEWFTFFYKKTGVTGPYVFGTGLLTFLLSKEWYVIEDEFSTGCAIFMLVYIAVKKFGAGTREYMDKAYKNEVQFYEKQKIENMKEIENSAAEQKKSVWYAEGQKTLMQAKRENVLMQLEIEYRKRMMGVYEQTKKQLDYHLDLHNTKRKLEQTHMVDWIVNSVVKSITPDQEKEALKKCIEDLNALAVKV